MYCVFRRVRLAALVFFACLVLAGPVQAVDLYQVSTIEALSAGLYEGKVDGKICGGPDLLDV